jgi:hypothetical protein
MIFSARNLDTLKWLGVVAMLVDHVWLYVFEAPTSYSEAAGALALPLFAFAVAEGVRSQTLVSRTRTLERLLLGALGAQIAMLCVGHIYPLNIIWGIGAGVALDTVLRYDLRGWRRWFVIGGAFVLGFVVEFGWLGTAVVLACCYNARRRADWSGGLVIVLLALLAPWNGGGFWALLALPIVWIASALPREVPRLRNGFYYVYALQWPLLAALRFLIGGTGPLS